MMKSFLFGIVVAVAVLCEASQDSPAGQAMMEITGSRMAAHVQFLADDLLEGRGTGTRGYDVAALYVAAEFEKAGLLPAGNNGSYFQQVPLRKVDLVREECSLSLIRGGKETALVMNEQYLIHSNYLETLSSLEAEVVFAGFGVSASELKYDDYAELDVRGKVVAIFRGAPSFFPASERAYYSSSYTKQKTAVERGAVGVIFLRTPRDEQNSPWERSVRQSALSGYHWLQSDGAPAEIFPQIRGEATFNMRGLEVLFEGSTPGLPQVLEMWKQDKFRSFVLPVKIRMKTVSRFDRVESPNVVGRLDGSDAALKNEYIVYTAHLDHIGITAPVNGDSINNGAYDNAAGIASLIETARAFTMLPKRPRRSILFLAVTAEEKGLQGADYFAANPTVPRASIVANINTDMFLMLYPFTDATALGAEHSSMGNTAAQALQTVGLKMTPDTLPDEVRFVRSDQYAFIRKGIPAINLISGFGCDDPNIKSEEVSRDWLRNIYHGPKDESSQKMYWESGEKLIRATFLIGYYTANANVKPQWNSGDFFGIMFAANKK